MEWSLAVPLQVSGGFGDICAEVPFTIPWLLHRADKMPHPFSKAGMQQCRELYRQGFVVRGEIPALPEANGLCELEWPGIDGLVRYKLGHLMGEYSGWQMPLRVKIPIDHARIPFTLEFPPQLDALAALADAGKRDLKAEFERLRVWGRVPSAFFGWDWAHPAFPFGIKRLPVLRTWKGAAIRGAFLSELPENRIMLTAFVEASRSGAARLYVDAGDLGRGAMFVEQSLHSGLNTVKADLGSPAFVRWGTEQGRGLYDVSIDLWFDGERISFRGFRTGVRSVHFAAGAGFGMRVNDHNLMLGANYVEPFFEPREWGTPAEGLLKGLYACGGRIIRVWGGGRYATEEFLTACDEIGIAVWQDMPFACGCYPVETQAETYKQELEDFLVRAAHHPSVVLICGGNENEWLFGKHRTDQERDFFVREARAIAAALRPDLPYIPDSPASVGEQNDPSGGDYHEWGFWSGRKGTERLFEKQPVFVSEFGFQAAPAVECLCEGESGSLQDLLKLRQFQKGGGEILDQYRRSFLGHCTLETTIEDSRWCQAHALGLAVRAWRFNPSFHGALIWQLNDVVPAVSWALFDGLGFPKPALGALCWASAARAIAVRQVGDTMLVRLLGCCGSGYLAVTEMSDGVISRFGEEMTLRQVMGEDPVEIQTASDFIRFEVRLDDGEDVNCEIWRKPYRCHGGVAHRILEIPHRGSCIALYWRGASPAARVLIESTDPRIIPAENPVTLLYGERRLVQIAMGEYVPYAALAGIISVRSL